MPPISGNTTPAAPATKPLINPSQTVAVQDNTRVATNPVIQTDNSNLSVAAETTNPFSSFTNKSAEVSVDGWKQGKNDSIEGILKNQGYSLKEIYSKDENGKSLVDRVAAANDLKNPNIIQPGQKLVVPSKENSESISTQDLKPGESQTASANNGEVSVDAKNSRDQDGNATSEVTANNGDASMSSATTVNENGRIDTSVSHNENGAQGNTVAIQGSTVTEVNTNTNADGSTIQVSDRDGSKDMSVTADGENVTIQNGGENGIATNVDISEKSSDGWFENAGRGIANFFGFGNDAPETASLEGASNVNVTKNSEGQATVTANGETLVQTAGDTDDTWLERAGEKLDGFFRWFGGGDDAGTEKSDVQATRRGRNRTPVSSDNATSNSDAETTVTSEDLTMA